MTNRTRVIAVAAAAATAAFAAGGVGAAVASTTGAKPGATARPGVHAKIVARSEKINVFNDLATQLGVSPARLEQALRAVKTSLIKAGAKPAEGQFEAALARILGIPQARVRHAFSAAQPRGFKAANGKAAAGPGIDAFAAVVARELHLSKARVSATLRSLFVAGRADPSSPAFAAAARSLGVSVQQLSDALQYGKQSLAGGN